MQVYHSLLHASFSILFFRNNKRYANMYTLENCCYPTRGNVKHLRSLPEAALHLSNCHWKTYLKNQSSKASLSLSVTPVLSKMSAIKKVLFPIKCRPYYNLRTGLINQNIRNKLCRFVEYIEPETHFMFCFLPTAKMIKNTIEKR